MAGAVVAAIAAGLVEMEVLMCLGVVLIYLTCVSTRLPWVLVKVAASVEKQFGPSAVYGKSNRAADLLCRHLLALVHNVVEEGEVRPSTISLSEVVQNHDKFDLAKISSIPTAERALDFYSLPNPYIMPGLHGSTLFGMGILWPS